MSIFPPELMLVFKGIIPSFAITFLGFLLGKWDKSLHQKTVSNLIYFLFSPCLVFTSLHKRSFDLREFCIIGGAVLFLLALMSPLAFILKKKSGIVEKGYYLPIIFMSTGTLSLPISLLLYGNEGLAKSVMFHLVNILVLYSLGVYIVSGKTSLLDILKIPALTAMMLGILDAKIHFSSGAGFLEQMLGVAAKGVEIVGYGAVPLMILCFGYSLNSTKKSDMKDGMSGGLLKIIAGPLLALLLIYIYRETGIMPTGNGGDVLVHLDNRTTEAVIMLNAAMPGPIMAYMLNVKFDSCPLKAAAMLSISTIGSIVTIPITFHLIQRFIFN
jgi:malate permease and related proteins